MSPPSGLRAQKKADNRRRLAECAFRLFVERGFDAVTVADIAAAAGVSVTTLFSYFPVKESLVFDVNLRQSAGLIEAVRSRSPGTPVVDAVEAHASATLGAMGYDPVVSAQFVRLLQETPALQEHIGQTLLRQWAPDLVQALRETVPDLDEMGAVICARHLLSALFLVTTFLDAAVVPRVFAPLRVGYGRLGA